MINSAKLKNSFIPVVCLFFVIICSQLNEFMKISSGLHLRFSTFIYETICIYTCCYTVNPYEHTFPMVNITTTFTTLNGSTMNHDKKIYKTKELTIESMYKNACGTILQQ